MYIKRKFRKTPNLKKMSKSSPQSRSTSGQNHPPILYQNFKIHGFTSWINMRLTPFDLMMSNVLNDLLNGTNMKYLMQSFTGVKDEKSSTFEK